MKRPNNTLRTAILLMVVLALVLAACAPEDVEPVTEPEPEPVEEPVEPEEEPVEPEEPVAVGPQKGGHLIQMINQDPTTLNPGITTAAHDHMVSCKMFEGLVVLDSDSVVQPQLAESWEVSDDATEFTFFLREGVRWHDGEPLTSADVKWTYENVTIPYGARAATAFEAVESIEAPDDHTVVITFSEPNGAFPTALECMSSAILPEHIYSDGDILDHPRNTQDPVGTGPFKFVEWVPGSHVTVEAFDDYWRRDEGMPFLEAITMRVIEDDAAAVFALEAGEIDFLNGYSLNPAEAERLEADPRIRVIRDPMPPSNDYLQFDVTEPPFDDVRVRHAVAHALDLQAIVDGVYFGLAEPGKSHIDSRLGWAHNPAVDFKEMYPHDPERAAELLDEAGYTPDADGVRLRVTLVNDGRDRFIAMGDIVREQLRAVGIEVQLEPHDRAGFDHRVFTERDFDMYFAGSTTGGEVSIGIERFYVSWNIRPVPTTNGTGYVNPEVDRLFIEGRSVVSEADRAVPYHRVQEILAEDLPLIILSERVNWDLASESFKNMELGQSSWFHLWEEVYYEPAE